jgi:hypothetical protein
MIAVYHHRPIPESVTDSRLYQNQSAPRSQSMDTGRSGYQSNSMTTQDDTIPIPNTTAKPTHFPQANLASLQYTLVPNSQVEASDEDTNSVTSSPFLGVLEFSGTCITFQSSQHGHRAVESRKIMQC